LNEAFVVFSLEVVIPEGRDDSQGGLVNREQKFFEFDNFLVFVLVWNSFGKLESLGLILLVVAVGNIKVDGLQLLYANSEINVLLFIGLGVEEVVTDLKLVPADISFLLDEAGVLLSQLISHLVWQSLVEEPGVDECSFFEGQSAHPHGLGVVLLGDKVGRESGAFIAVPGAVAVLHHRLVLDFVAALYGLGLLALIT